VEVGPDGEAEPQEGASLCVSACALAAAIPALVGS
jgi:hypothetical protein